jgi:tetratricopeptide (TPR) repeat protein
MVRAYVNASLPTASPDSHAVTAAIDAACAHWARGEVESALECCRRALALDPESVPALANMGTMMWLNGDVAGAERLYLQAHGLDPTHAGVMLNIATLRNEEGDLEASMRWVAMAEGCRPHQADVVWRKALLELAMGDYANGWAHYEAGLGHESIRGRAPGFTTPAWDGGPCRRLLIWHEQGLGDTIQFVRYAKLCKERAEKVMVLCPRELVRLIRRCPYVDDAAERVRPSDFDQHISIMSLPHRFSTTLQTVPAPIPYLFADPTASAAWAKRMRDGSSRRVGLVWAGNIRNEQLRFRVIDSARRLSLDAMQPWLDLPGVDLYSLQKGERRAETAGKNIIDFMDEVRDFADTAAIIANLDLVISADTSVAHLAGAMGKPVWVLSRLDACWRWLRNRADNPWYPTARVFGQTQRGSWSNVIDDVAVELARL